jgi:predicted nucleic acid-binding protein
LDKVFLDANVLFSAAYDARTSLRQLWRLEGVELLTSGAAAQEAARNLSMKRPDRMGDLAGLIGSMTVLGEPAQRIAAEATVGIDENDRPIFNACVAAKCTHFLTGDKRHFGRFYGKTVCGVAIERAADYLRRRLPNPRRRGPGRG